MQTKICSKCNQIKSIDNFYWRKDSNRHRNECKECQRAKTKIYSLNNSDKIREYCKKNKERRAEYNKNYSKEWRKNNIEYKKIVAKQWYKDNTEITKARSSERYKNNLEKEKECRKKYYRNNLDQWKEYGKRRRNNPSYNEYFRNKRKIDPMFRLNCNIKTAISMSLRGNKDGYHWEDLLGYTLRDLITHLEKLFKFGMTWFNYGKWHIDHVRPISSFNFNSYDDEEFKKCWNLNNLQPLWAEDNIRKSNKILLEAI